MMENNESNKPAEGEESDDRSSLPGIIVFICIAALVVVEYYALTLGCEAGIKAGGAGHNNIIGVLVPIFGMAQLALLLRIGDRWGRAPVSTAVTALILISLLQIPVSYSAGANYGQASGNSMRSRVLSNFRAIAMALDSYNLANKSYPPALTQLSPTYLPSLPNFDPPYAPLRYTLLDPKNTIANNRYFLWVPGPSGEFSIHEGPELKSTLEAWNGSAPPPAWLCDRTYDPTNGMKAANKTGDIWRIGIAK